MTFIRVRNIKQFQSFADRLTLDQLNILSGFVFPKFDSRYGSEYLIYLKALNEKFNLSLYGMPILESKILALKETRTAELLELKNLLRAYKDAILNIRVGATDFSSVFGVRRGIDYSIYDILPVRDCLSEILNFFNREDEDYVISAPVWEYFLVNKKMKFNASLPDKVYSSLLKRNQIVNDAVDGLLREVILDKANGFVGKTIIHPSHLRYVNAMQAVTLEEYKDAVDILEMSGGVTKSKNTNKMNESNPHRSWAKRVYYRSLAYGVIEDETSYFKLLLG